MSRLSSSNKLRRIALIAVFGALAYALMLVVHFKVSFLTLDLKDTVIALAGLYFGPGAALLLSVLVPLLARLRLLSLIPTPGGLCTRLESCTRIRR